MILLSFLLMWAGNLFRLHEKAHLKVLILSYCLNHLVYLFGDIKDVNSHIFSSWKLAQIYFWCLT